MGSPAGACGAWGEWAGGGELAPPWEGGPSPEVISQEVNAWLLEIKGQERFWGCFERSGPGELSTDLRKGGGI